jgi:hypothetical protein
MCNLIKKKKKKTTTRYYYLHCTKNYKSYGCGNLKSVVWIFMKNRDWHIQYIILVNNVFSNSTLISMFPYR